MNTRSLRFQLVAWYAALLTGCFVLIGAATYVVLQSSLVGALRETQLRRARQIGQLLLEEIRGAGEARVGEEIQARYAPDLNGRFVRITRGDGSLLYCLQRAQRPDLRSRGSAAALVAFPALKPRARCRCREAGRCS